MMIMVVMIYVATVMRVNWDMCKTMKTSDMTLNELSQIKIII